MAARSGAADCLSPRTLRGLTAIQAKLLTISYYRCSFLTNVKCTPIETSSRRGII